jgi:hypothetical protein
MFRISTPNAVAGASAIARVSTLIPLLASPHDGEVVATARAIERVLAAAGFDLHDLAGLIEPAPTVEPAPAGDDHWLLDQAHRCLDRKDMRSEREADFVFNIAINVLPAGIDLTAKQERWLCSIAARLERVAA